MEMKAGAEVQALLVKEEAFKRSLERELGETKSQVRRFASSAWGCRVWSGMAPWLLLRPTCDFPSPPPCYPHAARGCPGSHAHA